MFMMWLQDQEDRTDSTGRFARLVTDDKNNGCSGPIKTPDELLTHFFNKHAKVYKILRENLVVVYKEYAALNNKFPLI
jgi:hypothetical protein